MRIPASTSKSTLWRARRRSVWPGYSPARSRPGWTHQACTNSPCGQEMSPMSPPSPAANRLRANETIRSPAKTFVRAEVGGAGDGPERSKPRVDAVSRPANGGRGLSPPRAGGDVRDGRVEVAPAPERGRGDVVERGAVNQRADHCAHEPSGVDRASRGVRRARGPPGALRGSLRVAVPADGHCAEAHQRAVGC